jgi:hypothetical protein
MTAADRIIRPQQDRIICALAWLSGRVRLRRLSRAP